MCCGRASFFVSGTPGAGGRRNLSADLHSRLRFCAAQNRDSSGHLNPYAVALEPFEGIRIRQRAAIPLTGRGGSGFRPPSSRGTAPRLPPPVDPGVEPLAHLCVRNGADPSPVGSRCSIPGSRIRGPLGPESDGSANSADRSSGSASRLPLCLHFASSTRPSRT